MTIFTAVIKQRSQHAVTKTEIQRFFSRGGVGVSQILQNKSILLIQGYETGSSTILLLWKNVHYIES